MTFSSIYFPTLRPKTEAELAAENQYLRGEIERIVNGTPCVVRTVIAVNDDTATVQTPIAPIEVKLPKGAGAKLRPGHSVRVSLDRSQYVGPSEFVPSGQVLTVLRVIDAERCEVATIQGVSAVACGVPVEPGDRVALDPTGVVVTSNFGKVAAGFANVDHASMEWDDVIGATNAKRELREAIEGPILRRDLYAQFGKQRVRGILLSGPPGTGKTLLGRAAATALRKLHGAKGASGFLYVKGPELLNKFIGASESNIRDLFAKARAHHREHGFPALVFIDEADALLAARGSRKSSDMEATLVPQFLAELDGFEDTGALVILATNRPGALDPAVVRKGRIDRKVRVDRPTRDDVAKIIELNLRGKPLAEGATAEALATTAAFEVFDDVHVVRTVPTEAGEIDIPLHAAVNGAIAAGIAEQATDLAMQRALAGGNVGIAHVDMRAAVRACVDEHRDVALGEDVTEWVVARMKERAATAALAGKGKRVRT